MLEGWDMEGSVLSGWNEKSYPRHPASRLGTGAAEKKALAPDQSRLPLLARSLRARERMRAAMSDAVLGAGGVSTHAPPSRT